MKLLALLLVLFPVFSHADMGGINVGTGQGTRPFYGVDYEFNKDLPYLDLAFFGNQDYYQPYVSAGLQFEHFNFGLAASATFTNYSNGYFSGQVSFGPEIGYMYNLSSLTYIKENNSYLGLNGNYNFSSTISIGFNF